VKDLFMVHKILDDITKRLRTYIHHNNAANMKVYSNERRDFGSGQGSCLTLNGYGK
jgi:hypothetical protein